MGHTNLNFFRYSEVSFVVVVMLVGLSYELSNSKRHPYDFIKPLSSQDGMQGPSPYSYSDSHAMGSSFSLINSNKRPALSTSDFDRLAYHEDKERSLSSGSPSPFSSNTLFENVPLPPIRDEEKNIEHKRQNEHMGDFNARLSTTKNVPVSTMTKNLYNARNAIRITSDIESNPERNKVNMPIIGDTTKDNKRRVVIPLRYRNKRRRNNNDDPDVKGNQGKKEEDMDDISNNHHELESLSAQETKYSVSSAPSIQISISDLEEPLTTTERQTVVTSSSKMENKVPAFVLNLKNEFVTESKTDPIETRIDNKKHNKTINDPIALPLHADDLKNWGADGLNEEDDTRPSSKARSVDNDNDSDRPKFSDTNVLFADGDIYSRLQKHKQVFTSRRGPDSKSSSYHTLQSREIPRTSSTSLFQDMTPSGSSPTNSTKHPKAQPYRRYKSGYKDDYYYYDYDYDNGDYVEDDYYYRDYDGRLSNFGGNAVRRQSKPTSKPKFKLVRKKPSKSSSIKSRYPPSSITNHRYATSSPVNNRRHQPPSNHRHHSGSQGSENRFQNHRLATKFQTKSSNSFNNYHSKSLTSSDKYLPHGYNPHSNPPSNHLVKKSNKRIGSVPGSYETTRNQGGFSRPPKTPYSAIQSSPIPYNNPRRLNSVSNRNNRPFTSSGAGVVSGAVNGPVISSSTRRDKYYDYDDDYYYDDEIYDDYYNYEDEPKRARQKARRRQSDAIDRQYGGGGGGANPLTLLVAPLAAISLLAAAAAVALNPVLVSVSLTGKKRRKRRSLFGLENNFDTNFDSVGESSSHKLSFDGHDVTSSITPEVQEKIDEMQVLEKFLGSVPSDIKYQQQILSMYLSCSGYTDVSNKCLDRVVCEYSDSDSAIEEEDRDVISIVLYNIMGNDFVGEEYKARLRKSAKIGRDSGKMKKTSSHKKSCFTEFPCLQLDRSNNNLIPKSTSKIAPKQLKQNLRRNYRVKSVKKD